MRVRLIRDVTGTLLIAGMASVAYAWAPAPAGESMNSFETSIAAQQDQAPPPKQDESKPAKQDESKPAKPTRETKDAKSPRSDQQPVHPAQPDKSDRQQPKADRQEQPKPATRNQRQSAANPARPQPARQGHGQPAGRNARIPDNDFKAHFGRPHAFAVRQVVTTTRIVPNQTQFVYGGYTFIFLDPWPDDWSPTDDCYIDYVDDEYFLIDVAHPGARIALSIIAG
jgi:outer membrane biosynthesis protein TonB